MFKHLVTSGCSFSDNDFGMRWPHYLAQELGVKLYNRGQGSAGNDWISMSAIFQTQKLIESGILPGEICVVVMWSGVNRSGIFINKENPLFSNYISTDVGNTNPVSFCDTNPNVQQPAKEKGFLLGSPHCTWKNSDITKIKKIYLENFYNEEWQIISSLQYWLNLQWFCKIQGVKLLNLTYMNIFHHPYGKSHSNKFYETYPDTTKYLFNMIDLNGWWFDGDNYDGVHEWVKRNGYTLNPGSNLHPSEESYEKFVKEVLLNRVGELL